MKLKWVLLLGLSVVGYPGVSSAVDARSASIRCCRCTGHADRGTRRRRPRWATT